MKILISSSSKASFKILIELNLRKARGKSLVTMIAGVLFFFCTWKTCRTVSLNDFSCMYNNFYGFFGKII